MLKKFLNLNYYCPVNLYDPISGKEINFDMLSKTLPPSLAKLELSRDKYIEIPKELQLVYKTYRPTDIFRAKDFEKAIRTDCQIYIKDEGGSPTKNHKANSSFLIAYLCKKDGIGTITTETTGNWGIALAMAGKKFGIKVVCFLDFESHKKRPDRKKVVEEFGAKVIVVNPKNNEKIKDLLTLSADAAIEYTKNLKDAYYIFGSVYNYFIIPQSVIGLEIKAQLLKIGEYPDIVIGSCGGGANLLGTSAVFLADIMDEKRKTKIVSAEADTCPILSEGKMGMFSIDNLNHYPLMKTYGIKGLKKGNYIGGLGSTIVASSVADFHSRGLIEVNQFSSIEARNAAELFFKSEGRLVALETGYAIAAVIKQAKVNSKKIIVVNISSGDTDKQFYSKMT